MLGLESVVKVLAAQNSFSASCWLLLEVLLFHGPELNLKTGKKKVIIWLISEEIEFSLKIRFDFINNVFEIFR